MQKPILPIQISGATPAPARAKNGQPEGGAQFNQALNREIEQRKAPPASAAKQNGPARQQQQAQSQTQHTDKAGAPKKTGNEGQRVAKEKAGAREGDAQDGAAQGAAGQHPMVDMLALVASFNQLAAGAAAPGAPAADPLQGGPGGRFMDGKFAAAVATAGMDKLAAAGAALLEGGIDGGAADVQPAVFGDMMTRPGGDARAGARQAGAGDAGHAAQAGQDKAALGKDLAAAGRAGDAAPGKAALPDPAQFAQLRARDAGQPDIALKESQVAAPASAPVQQSSLALATAAGGAGAGDKIAARVGTPGWDNQVGQKIVWMVAGKEQSASLTLNPPDMGPMQVMLSVKDDQATVTFSAATPEVRQALEDAMPKLREMMSESGIELGDANVNDGSAQRQARDEAAGRGVRGDAPGAGEETASGSAAEAEAKAAARPARAGELPGLVDTFA